MKQAGEAGLSSRSQNYAEADFEDLREQAEAYSLEEIIDGLTELRRRRTEHLLRAHTDPMLPPEERKQALYDYCVVPMAEERITRSESHIHNPYVSPTWLIIAQSQLAEFITEDVTARETLANLPLFRSDEDEHYLRSFANSVSASILPLNPYEDDKVFAVGVLTEQIRPWVLPDIRADELTLA